jgi:uncharacterized iron-regulated membrane protein
VLPVEDFRHPCYNERMAKLLWHSLVVLHRYLGIAVGVMMLVWFASGIVMMYVEFPRQTEPERVRALAPIPWDKCCRVAAGLIPDDAQIYRIQVEAILGTPVMRLRRPPRPDRVVDLMEGVGVLRFTPEDASAIAGDAMARIQPKPGIVAAELIDTDQWTISGYNANRPLHRLMFDDPDHTTLYVSSTNGEIVLRTTATQRFWNWFGTIPHWLYFSALRSDGPLWSTTVIWASLLGSFLTLLGLYLGIAQFRRGKDGKLSPYRGWFYWHHLAGLVFGIFTLTFVVSGLISMNPWGFLEGRGGGGGELRRLEGPTPNWGEVRTSLAMLKERGVDAVSLSTAPFAGKLFWLATATDGTVKRLDATGAAAPLPAGELAQAAERMLGTDGIFEQGLLRNADSYYYAHDEQTLPVYRIIANDGEQTRYYLNPATGALLNRLNATRRWHRWLFDALHQFDFAAWIRARPAWDIVMITLLLGGVAASGTGIYLAVRRIRNDLVVVFRWLNRLRRIGRKPSLSDGASPA